MHSHAPDTTTPETPTLITSQIKSEITSILRVVDWRVLLVVPIMTGLLIGSHWVPGLEFLGDKNLQEIAAIAISALMFVAYVARFAKSRTKFSMMLLVAASAFFARELHFDGTDYMIKAMPFVMVGWAWVWRDDIRDGLTDRRQMTWLALAVVMYVYSQFCARRGFKFLPAEKAFHEVLEEGSENCAHIVMLIAAFKGSWSRVSTTDQN